MAALRCISMFLKERATPSERYQWTNASERKCVAASEHIFYVKDCMADSRYILMFFNERVAAFERY